ncbi:MAG: hypothetical protein ACHQY2_07130, partial [Candidatus Eremiobacterales bacterium]
MKLILVVTGLLASPAVAANPPEIPAKTALFSPRVTAHEVMSWRGLSTENTLKGTVPVDTFTVRTTINCGVISSADDEVRLRGDVWDARGDSKQTFARRLPDYAIRDGNVTAKVGGPVAANPICMFYSRTMYGSPPERLRVGSTWRFSNAASLRDAWVPNGQGVVTVTHIDVAANRV